jgi:protein ImuB
VPRLACLHVPHFPLAAWLRSDPEPAGAPVAVTEGRGPRARIVACSPEAARQGVTTGQTAAQGVALCGTLRLRAASADAERGAQAALRDVACSFSARVEDAAPGMLYLDVGGWRMLWDSESALASAMTARALAVGLDVWAGIASTKIAARLAALRAEGSLVVPAEEEWRFLAPLPIQLLEPSPALQSTLARWGIRSLGDLAALPAGAVATRLGPEGALLARRARGEDEHPLAPLSPPLHFVESFDLDYGIETLEPFLFAARALLDRLIARIALRGLVCGDLRLSLGLANRGRDERTVTVAAPSNDGKALLALLRLHLETHPAPAPIETIRLAAVPERLRPAQLDLFRPSGPSPAGLAATLARLTALCGADRLGAPVVADSHRPDAYGLAPFESTPRPPELPPLAKGGQGGFGVLHVALRAVRPPRALEVFCDRGRLDFVRPAEAEREIACNGRVVTFAGPCRLHGEWWREESAFSRDYYDVQLSDGAIYRLFFDRRRQQWFVDGVYD